MSFWTFLLLVCVFGGIGVIHLLNSESRAGTLARALASGVIERLFGRRVEGPAPRRDKE